MFIKDFLEAAKKDKSLWKKWHFKMAYVLFMYFLFHSVLFLFIGMESLGGKNANLALLLVMYFLTAGFLAMYLVVGEINKGKGK